MQRHPLPARTSSAGGTGTSTGIVRLVAKLTALSLLTALLVVLPAPRVEAVEEIVVDTRAPALAPAGEVPTAPTAKTRLPSGEDAAADLADPDRRVATEVVEPFTMLGVTVPSVPDDHLLARARVDGAWSDWMELEINPDHQPEGDEDAAAAEAEPGVHTAPIWFGEADAYEVNAPASVPSVEVHLLRPETTSVRVKADTTPAGAAPSVSAPAILSRSQWGAREPKVTPSIAADLKLAVVHHSVNSNTYSMADVPSMLRGIQTYHMDVQGWNDIAYNFAVDRFGRTWEARAGGVKQTVIGGHAKGFNTYTTGVMVLGDLTSTTPSQATVNSVADVIGWKFALDRQDVRGTTQFESLGGPRYAEGTVVQMQRIVGHRDVGQTGCPGSRLYARLDEIRLRAAARFDAYLAEQPEIPLFGDFDGDGFRDVLRYRPGRTTDLLWMRPASGIRRSALTIDGVFRPAVGDFDGDGRDDIFWYGPGSHYDRVWYGGPGGFSSRVVDIAEQGFAHVAELDGDGRDDVILYASGGAPDRIYQGLGDRTMKALPLAVDGNHEVLIGDFDGDQRDDVFWYGKGTRDDSRAFSNGNGAFTYVDTSVDGWFAPVVGDFDGNLQDDVLWYAPGPAVDAIWWSEPLVRGSVTQGSISVKGEGYRPQVGDVNGDGRDDVFWYKPGPAADPLWGWPLARSKSDRILSVGGTFVPDVGSYDGDGLADVAWISPTGASYLWVATGGGEFRSVTLG